MSSAYASEKQTFEAILCRVSSAEELHFGFYVLICNVAVKLQEQGTQEKLQRNRFRAVLMSCNVTGELQLLFFHFGDKPSPRTVPVRWCRKYSEVISTLLLFVRVLK